MKTRPPFAVVVTATALIVAAIPGAPAWGADRAACAGADSTRADARERLDREEWPKALGLLEPLLAECPDDARALVMIAEAYAGVGQPQRALDVLRRAVELHPDDIQARCELGNAYTDWNQYEAAIGELTAVLERAPDSTEGHVDLACALGLVGRTEEALAHLESAVRLAPDHPAARMNLAAYHRGRQDWAAAIHEYVRVREIDCWYPMVDECLRDVLGLARDSLQARLKQQPGEATTLCDLAWCEAYRGDLKKARKLAEQAIAAAPGQAAFLRAKGEFCVQLDQYDDAIACLRAAVAADSSDWAGQAMLARVYNTKGRSQEALAALERAPRGDQVISVQIIRGDALAGLERFDDARAAYRCARKLGADSPSLRFNLAVCALELKDYDEAWAQARAAQRRHHPRVESLFAALARVSREPD